jgi:hypothetical protein
VGGPLLKRNARGWEKTRHSETKHLARVAHPDFERSAAQFGFRVDLFWDRVAITSANWYQFPRCAFILLLSGHHSTVPRPTTSVPIFFEPSLISMVKEFWLVLLVISTAAGRWATTAKFFSAILHFMPNVARCESRLWVWAATILVWLQNGVSPKSEATLDLDKANYLILRLINAEREGRILAVKWLDAIWAAASAGCMSSGQFA